ncbi:DUF5683 domain-containing protein [Carboxylicivirga sp. N1Y90]|uniref:DUF5683 domain-containing protein n=1 Tax=Carboxylicivirga fragile TaxID=3417571 RepID=UPI003D338B70|nr:hypothetical protein [Marinilabiliaceae bacterium N1Y90]
MTTKLIHRKWLLGLCLSLVLLFNTRAQESDTLVAGADTAFIEGTAIDLAPVVKVHSPHKATFYAAILPGLGQAYNKKYWKIPILYAGIGGLAYAIHFNSKYYNSYKSAYRDFIIRDPGNKSYLEFIPPNLTEEQVTGQYEDWFESALLNKKQYYRRYRDLSYLGMVGIYIIQMVDAAVDAHFYNFDISDDLSMRVEPAMMAPAPGEFAGLGVQIQLKF